jgi:hypothetical protein
MQLLDGKEPIIRSSGYSSGGQGCWRANLVCAGPEFPELAVVELRFGDIAKNSVECELRHISRPIPLANLPTLRTITTIEE